MTLSLHNTVYTIGHSTHTQEHLVDLLQRHGITALCDVRSRPYSKMNPQFNRPDLKLALAKRSIRYVFLGDELGARSKDPACYEAGRVRYDRIAQTELFRQGLHRITTGMEKFTLALMCAEKDPLYCHRTILVARHLVELDVPVKHIHADGELETQEEALARLVRVLDIREDEDHMFRSREQLFEEVYELQEKRIAYEIDPSSDSGLDSSKEIYK